MTARQPKQPACSQSSRDAIRRRYLTYIATDEGWLFLAVVVDLFSRQVVGWSLREDMTKDIVIDALRMAWFKRHPPPRAGADLSQRPGQPVRQWRVQERAGRIQHHALDGPPRRLLGHSTYDRFERCFRPDPCWDWCPAFALTCRSDCSAHLGHAEPAASDLIGALSCTVSVLSFGMVW